MEQNVTQTPIPMAQPEGTQSPKSELPKNKKIVYSLVALGVAGLIVLGIYFGPSIGNMGKGQLDLGIGDTSTATPESILNKLEEQVQKDADMINGVKTKLDIIIDTLGNITPGLNNISASL